MENSVNKLFAEVSKLNERVSEIEEYLGYLHGYHGHGNDMLMITNKLVQDHGEYVDKKDAAKIIGVTRATIYAMLRDGRIEAACGGSKVSVRSIARHLASPRPNRKVK